MAALLGPQIILRGEAVLWLAAALRAMFLLQVARALAAELKWKLFD